MNLSASLNASVDHSPTTRWVHQQARRIAGTHTDSPSSPADSLAQYSDGVPAWDLESSVPAASPPQRERSLPPAAALQRPKLRIDTRCAAPRERSFSKSSVPRTAHGDVLDAGATPSERDILAAKVKKIYASLSKTESKCQHGINVYTRGTPSAHTLNAAQDEKLFALHRRLLDEHHELFTTIETSSDSEMLKGLLKRELPKRLWRDGIHAYMTLLRKQSCNSSERFLAFFHIAYAMLASLYETVPAFQLTWAEHLGDLARYRMEVTHSGTPAQQEWADVACRWYQRCASETPGVGRIAHHMASLAGYSLNAQIFLYGKALMSQVPFEPAAKSKDALMPRARAASRNPMLARFEDAITQTTFAIFDRSVPFDPMRFVMMSNNLVARFSDRLYRPSNPRVRVDVAMLACSQINAMFNFGQTKTPLQARFLGLVQSATTSSKTHADDARLSAANHVWVDALDVALDKPESAATSPYVHISLLFLLEALRKDAVGGAAFIKEIPWRKLADFGNLMVKKSHVAGQPVKQCDFATLATLDLQALRERGGTPLFLPEDALVRGHFWSSEHMTGGWPVFDAGLTGLENMEARPETPAARTQRLLWTMAQIAAHSETACGFRIQADNTLIAIAPEA